MYNNYYGIIVSATIYINGKIFESRMKSSLKLSKLFTLQRCFYEIKTLNIVTYLFYHGEVIFNRPSNYDVRILYQFPKADGKTDLYERNNTI